MRKSGQAALISALLLCMSVPSYATTFSFGVITGAPGDDSRGWNDKVSGSFTDYATFSTIKTATFSASITNSFADSPQFIDDFTLTLYKGLLGSGVFVASSTSTVPNTPPLTQGAQLQALSQLAGDYYLQVTGTTGNGPTYGGSLSIKLSPIPLPEALPMFGLAVLGLGTVGYGIKRKRATGVSA